MLIACESHEYICRSSIGLGCIELHSVPTIHHLASRVPAFRTCHRRNSPKTTQRTTCLLTLRISGLRLLLNLKIRQHLNGKPFRPTCRLLTLRLKGLYSLLSNNNPRQHLNRKPNSPRSHSPSREQQHHLICRPPKLSSRKRRQKRPTTLRTRRKPSSKRIRKS